MSASMCVDSQIQPKGFCKLRTGELIKQSPQFLTLMQMRINSIVICNSETNKLDKTRAQDENF